MHRHEGGTRSATRNLGDRTTAELLGFTDPASRQIRIDAMGHRDRSARHATCTALSNDLRLEFGAVIAPTSAPSAAFVGDSDHVSAKKSVVDTSILKPSDLIKVPRLDAYVRSSARSPRA